MKKWNRIAIVNFTLAVLLTVVSLSFAAYTSLSSVKRVITVKGTEQLFSSNILIPYTDSNDLQTRIISFSEEEATNIIGIEIANYLQGDTSKYDMYGVEYNLTLELIDLSGNRVTDSSIYSLYQINGHAMENNPVVFSDSLQGRTADRNYYEIEIPSEHLASYRFRITAVPSNSQYLSIGRIIAVAAEEFTLHWAGKFLNSEQMAINNLERVGIFNYQISGSVEEDCILSWNTSKVEIDPWFLVDMGVSDSVTIDGSFKSVLLSLGKAGTPVQYDIKFYRTEAAQDSRDTWGDITDREHGYILFKNSVTE